MIDNLTWFQNELSIIILKKLVLSEKSINQSYSFTYKKVLGLHMFKFAWKSALKN